ncbi:hypothetical protein NHX12_015119 [Muraenolepis orangiensis]|uniref:TERF1-interacting nuclear factor 2 N-terminal domain-containing protein n=1 Tax=Muraenolepis orangiensis TaxID=630683 RepID=A0A9Q0D9Y2_9TELE|nr:hypothetical protein NHX12_015119 [Muraenolepis orangiensis]
MAPTKAAEKALAPEPAVSLPFPCLQLLAPPVRLVSAAVWTTLKRRDALQYGAAEEYVTALCESVPGLLTPRHQGKLTLGLRGRFILELLLRSQDGPDREAVGRHMERFRAPTPPSSSAHKPKKDVKIERTVSGFRKLEEFPEEYGAKFDQELEKLLWEFLLRLDQLLPAPNLAQTVSWLSAAPPVLEECARAATQPQLLRTILQYQACLGHLESAASLPPKMGDSILTSLSLSPSGKQSSEKPLSEKPLSDQPPSDQPPSVQPPSEQPPSVQPPSEQPPSVQPPSEQPPSEQPPSVQPPSEQPPSVQPPSEQPPSVQPPPADRRSSLRGELRTGLRKQAAGKRRFIAPVIGLISNQDVPAMKRAKPTVLLRRLDGASLAAANIRTEGVGGSPSGPPPSYNKDFCDGFCIVPVVVRLDYYVVFGIGEAHPTPGDGDDIIADSEDESTKHFKALLFVKHYYKTKHDTYVPTLREFWKPLSSLLSPQ